MRSQRENEIKMKSDNTPNAAGDRALDESPRADGQRPPVVATETEADLRRIICKLEARQLELEREVKALRETDVFSRAILDALHALVVVLDAKGTILASNTSWRGFAEEGATTWQQVSEGRNYLAVCEQSGAAGCLDASRSIKGIQDVITGRLSSWTNEYACHSPTERRWFVCRVTRLPGEGPVRVVVAHEDITAIKQAQEAQHASSERLRLAVQSANLGLWDWDMLTNRVDFSVEWKNQIGYADHEIGHDFKEWEDRLHPDDRVAALAHLRRYLARPVGPHLAEFRLRHKDGSWRWIYTRAEIFRDPGGNPVRMVGCHLDVTEHRHLTEQVLRTQRMEAIGTLAGGIAHDLNNILAPTLLITEMIRRKTADPELLRLVEMIDVGTKRGAHIIRQVLVFSRGTQGQRKSLGLGRLLADLEGLLRETFPREIKLSVKLARGLKPIMADATQFHQVVMNLCLNARDAMAGTAGELTLNARNVEVTAEEASAHPQAKPGPHVVLEVRDTGHGMSEAIIGRIFDPFFTTKDVGQGTGLGLSSALGIVRSHQGFITVASKPGAGSIFRVFIPADETASAPVSEAPIKTVFPQGNGELVLVVDDEPVVRETTQLILERNGYRVISAANGREACTLFGKNSGSLRLVVTDMVMPEMDGLALIRVLRVQAPRLPIVVSSGHMLAGKVDALATLGVTEILQKPFGADNLLSAAHRLLQAPGSKS